MKAEEYYHKTLADAWFTPCTAPLDYPAAGKCWQIDDNIGSGYYWIYDAGKHYNIKIHDFSFREDTVVDLTIPECLSVTWYDSVSGEELTPYRQMKSQVIKSFLGGYEPFRAVIHKRVPIRSIGIEYTPDYYKPYLKDRYGAMFQSPQEAFRSIDETAEFPEMTLLLHQLWNYCGVGVAAELFYDAKAAEVLSLVFERHRRLNEEKTLPISDADRTMLHNLASYIGDHYSGELSLKHLSHIACMGTTKLKKCFKAYFGSTISDYIVATRIGQAEHLLAYTNLPIGQVAQAVGYSNAGRFAELFRKEKGVLPMEYRKITQG